MFLLAYDSIRKLLFRQLPQYYINCLSGARSDSYIANVESYTPTLIHFLLFPEYYKYSQEWNWFSVQ